MYNTNKLRKAYIKLKLAHSTYLFINDLAIETL